MCPLCYQGGGSLLHCLSTLTGKIPAVYFCCTGLGVTSTGRYPASCPMKPGLSSSAAFRHLQPRLSVLLNTIMYYTMLSRFCPPLCLHNQDKLINCFSKQHLSGAVLKYKELLYFEEEPPVDPNTFLMLSISNMDNICSMPFS